MALKMKSALDEIGWLGTTPHGPIVNERQREKERRKSGCSDRAPCAKLLNMDEPKNIDPDPTAIDINFPCAKHIRKMALNTNPAARTKYLDEQFQAGADCAVVSYLPALRNEITDRAIMGFTDLHTAVYEYPAEDTEPQKAFANGVIALVEKSLQALGYEVYGMFGKRNDDDPLNIYFAINWRGEADEASH